VSLQVIGAGVGRTGTTSLKLALERLLGEPCYHMYEVFQHPEHIARWHAHVRGELASWDSIYDGYAATVDWPGAAFWRELHAANPSAIVLLSVRDDALAWFESIDATISPLMARPPQRNARLWYAMATEMLATRFVPAPFERERALEAYERHNAAVREAVPGDQLLEWRPGDGWDPLCERLGVPVPEEAFPHANTREDYGEFLAQLPPVSWRDRVWARVRRHG